MKKIIKRIILIISLLCLLNVVGCAKVVSEEFIQEEITIRDTYYIPSQPIPYVNAATHTTMVMVKPASYEVKFRGKDNSLYILNDSNSYNICKHRKGEKVVGNFKIIHFDDGSTKKKLKSINEGK